MAATQRVLPTLQLDSGLIIPASAGAGKVLTSDASGNAAWATPGAAALPYAHVTRTATTVPASGSFWSWDAETADNDAIHDNATNNSRLTCKTAGLYVISAQIGLSSPTSGHQFTIRKNGSAADVDRLAYSSNANSTWWENTTATCIADLAVNDYVELLNLSTPGGTCVVGKSYFKMVRIGSK